MLLLYDACQRVYDDDDSEGKNKEASTTTPSTSSAPSTEQEILGKFQDALKSGLSALEYFSVAMAEGGKPEGTGEDDDDDDAEGTPGGAMSKTLVMQPAKYVRSHEYPIIIFFITGLNFLLLFLFTFSLYMLLNIAAIDGFFSSSIFPLPVFLSIRPVGRTLLTRVPYHT